MPPRSRGAVIAAAVAMSVMRVVSAAPIAAQIINPATTPLRANFLAEGAARTYDVITYEGPSYDGCCPLPENGGGGGGDAGGEILGCCATGGCCPSSETTDAYGVYLACCTAQRGTMDENRARSRVSYTGPSYDGCCPNGDGLNMGCCASAAGCCPRDGGARHACCPTIALQDDLEGVDTREDSEIIDMRGNEDEYDDVNGDRVWGGRTTRKASQGGASTKKRRARWASTLGVGYKTSACVSMVTTCRPCIYNSLRSCASWSGPRLWWRTQCTRNLTGAAMASMKKPKRCLSAINDAAARCDTHSVESLGT